MPHASYMSLVYRKNQWIAIPRLYLYWWSINIVLRYILHNKVDTGLPKKNQFPTSVATLHHPLVFKINVVLYPSSLALSIHVSAINTTEGSLSFTWTNSPSSFPVHRFPSPRQFHTWRGCLTTSTNISDDEPSTFETWIFLLGNSGGIYCFHSTFA